MAGAVDRLRLHIQRHRLLAGWLVGAALLLKLLVPSGFMPVVSGASFTMILCTSYGTQQVVMTSPGHESGDGQHAAKAEMPCAFAGLGTPSLAAGDAITLAVAIALVFAAVAFAAADQHVGRVANLRPPLRGPPAA